MIFLDGRRTAGIDLPVYLLKTGVPSSVCESAGFVPVSSSASPKEFL